MGPPPRPVGRGRSTCSSSHRAALCSPSAASLFLWALAQWCPAGFVRACLQVTLAAVFASVLSRSAV